LTKPRIAASPPLTHLDLLESESIHILREVVAECDRPVMLYSIGKDSAVLLHLARKAFYPARVPFPLLHIDTTWKFREMIEFRDRLASEPDIELRVHTNARGVSDGINPFDHGASVYTDVMKTEALRQALDSGGFANVIGGARRDEEKSRAKERIFSARAPGHRWDARSQRPELWDVYNTRPPHAGSLRVFPLSNWTELDVWMYIRRERIAVPPLYFAAARMVVNRSGLLIAVDDARMRLRPGETPELRMVRFRTLGCYPLTGAIESTAATIDEIVTEIAAPQYSERQGRAIDHDDAESMEEKKLRGYF
jgi:sulfate adenylyltransferase subunit 2